MRYRTIRWYDAEPIEFSDLVGKTFTKVERLEDDLIGDSDSILFTCEDGSMYGMWYEADCCASCSIEDIAGDLQDLVGSPIVRAEENSSEDKATETQLEEAWRTTKDYSYDDSHTWTFYRLQTANGLVVIRWYGSSNGYYSERATFGRVVLEN